MISRRSVLLTLAFATLSVASAPVLAGSRRLDVVRMFDTDNDGTLDLPEVKKAASALFARLDRDHDGTLDKRELAGGLTPKEIAAADPGHGGTRFLGGDLVSVVQGVHSANPGKGGHLD